MKLLDLSAKQDKREYPLVPLKELVLFPQMVAPVFIGLPRGLKAVEAAMEADRHIAAAFLKDDTKEPEMENLYSVVTVAKVLQVLKLPDGSSRVLLEGLQRGTIQRLKEKKEAYFASLQIYTPLPPAKDGGDAALMITLQNSFKKYIQLWKKVPQDARNAIEKAETPDKLVNLLGANIPFRKEYKIEILAESNRTTRLEKTAEFLEAELEILTLQNRIHGKVKKRMEKNQREYYLNEQIKEINRELGKEQDEQEEARELLERIKARNPRQEVLEKAEKESRRLTKLQPMSPESGVLRTYLEWLGDIPWSEKSGDNRDIEKAAVSLDKDHYNMVRPKERVLDFIAVRQLKADMKGPILCFVGPPGTGKTSLGRSVARALNREFVRISLGGVRDEAEIRGHRKTYVGALPGKIVQAMRKVGTVNPVFLLDEIDKMNSDFRGDPASALLEVLDPEQNNSFTDHYLEVPYDLSQVMFITTANSLHSIPHALRDRMEIIEIPGYTDYEKIQIARGFILPKQQQENGLEKIEISFREKALLHIIRRYTMESGVRNLERRISAVMRKVAREALKREELADFRKTITVKTVEKYLGPPPYHPDLVYRGVRPGLAHGLAWTEMGGTLLPVEVAVVRGSGELILTGSLGDVMKESARTALSYLRAQYSELGLSDDFQKDKDIHIHVPEGAIPKDGPSAGITLTAALLSAFRKKPLKGGIAMTGEITLTGRVLPIGGVKEKVLAAHRNQMQEVLMPRGNEKDRRDIPREVSGSMTFHYVDSILEALQILFEEL